VLNRRPSKVDGMRSHFEPNSLFELPKSMAFRSYMYPRRRHRSLTVDLLQIDKALHTGSRTLSQTHGRSRVEWSLSSWTESHERRIGT